MLGYLEPNQVTVVVMGKLGQPMLGYHENEREKERQEKEKERMKKGNNLYEIYCWIYSFNFCFNF